MQQKSPQVIKRVAKDEKQDCLGAKAANNKPIMFIAKREILKFG